MWTDEPLYRCLDCKDDRSGWRPFWCHGMGDHKSYDAPEWAVGTRRSCGRVKDHPPHNFVDRCECWQRRQQLREQRATETV